MRPPNPGTGLVHQLRVTLLDVEPAVWRRLHVEANVSLERLHTVLQKAMGWQNAHLYEFEVRGRRYGVPDPEEPEYKVEPVWKITLREAAPVEGTSFRYVYDLGDHWEHELVVEQIQAAKEPFRHPVCLAGERRCPPEDCGALRVTRSCCRDPDHPEHKERREWLGRRFDPEAFDLAAVNRKLRLLLTWSRPRDPKWPTRSPR